jgi:phosphoenolpyruvate carboxykinase (GTP)
MLILGVENPQGEISYVAAAFPSACGKTNLAMMVPPDGFKSKGYKVWTIGDDIAWLRVGKDGRLWACNPESGFFGVAPGTNMSSNPNALIATQKDTIFTNVVLTKDKTVWWEKMDKNPPQDALDWKGNPWDPASGENGAHPNSRFTAPARNCPCIASNWEDPKGVPLSAIVFGGRRAKTAPLVYQSRDWRHGVFVGSIMASETTAAQTGAVGVVRRDPMAMLPFCGYNMGDYWQHWLDMGDKITNQPKIFNVNWFRLDDKRNFIWPGFGENFRVLDWIIRRCKNEVDARETEIGYLPNPKDIDISDLDYNITADWKFGLEELTDILKVEKDHWKEDVKSIKEFYAQFGDRLPKALGEYVAELEQKLG